MTRTTATLIAVIAGLAAVAAPVLLALHLANRQGEAAEKSRVLAYARDTLHRSNRAADQIYEGIDRLLRTGAADPCSAGQMAMMGEIDLASSYIQAIGRVSGNRLICSSLGDRPDTQLDLGTPDVVTSTGTIVRSSVALALGGGVEFTVVERNGYAAIIHKDLPIDVSTDSLDVSLATITPDNRQVRSSRGLFKLEWIDALAGRAEATFADGEFVVAVVKSDRYATVALAALPIRHKEARAREAALVLVPTGLGASALLIWAILHGVRIQTAMPAVLKLALRRREFSIVYQPIVDLRTRVWIGAEALIRWRRPTGEMIRPDLFIQVAEETGLIQRVTEEVVKLVARDAAGLFTRHPDFHIGINLSAADLHSPRTVELLGGLARVTGAGPGNLLVEATERGLMNADLARDMIRSLRASGTRVAIDDFGTGYSSLSYLESFELDFLKIDKSFVDKIGTQAATSQVVPHIIEMAKDLRLALIAEGVETETQARFLLEHDVQFAQGWLFSPPLPFAELDARLAEHRDIGKV